jgi:hypothetical protein
VLHSIFDVLAFKNDIQFWKNKKDIKGLSVRMIIMNVICQSIIFLYLLHNKANFMIIVSVGIGAVIEAWKINKACDVKWSWNGRRRLPRVTIHDKQSYVNSNTKIFDEKATKCLFLFLLPCVLGYAIYSLLYHDHTGWYSFILSTLVGCIYTFGFVMMTPQLFINYKLKSVAHLPWKTFIYKALNTFIDDIFAFIIKMPTLHRLGCFRDDVLFFIYIYQWWIYPVDKTRVNEFGQQSSSSATIAAAASDDPAAVAALNDNSKNTTVSNVLASPPIQSLNDIVLPSTAHHHSLRHRGQAIPDSAET